jgi:hypothetical protein
MKPQVYIMIGIVAILAATTVSATFLLPSAFAAQIPGCSGNPHDNGGSGNPHDTPKIVSGNPHQSEGKGTGECPGFHP